MHLSQRITADARASDRSHAAKLCASPNVSSAVTFERRSQERRSFSSLQTLRLQCMPSPAHGLLHDYRQGLSRSHRASGLPVSLRPHHSTDGKSMTDARDSQPSANHDAFCFPDATSRSRLHVVQAPLVADDEPANNDAHAVNDKLAPRKLRIAQVAPLFESVPPKTYGGTERIVHYLTEGLVERGHHVTLFASGDSCTSAKLVSAVNESLRLSKTMRDPQVWHSHQLMQLVSHLNQFDIVHFHNGFYHAPIWSYLSVPQVSTMHNRLDNDDALVMLTDFPQLQLISISDSQRGPALATEANFVGTVYNGVPAEGYHFQPQARGCDQGDYLAFLGRFTPDKGPEQAIEIAKRLGMRLKMAAKIDPSDQAILKNAFDLCLPIR